MSDVLREAVLIAATLTIGLVAGVFGIYNNAITIRVNVPRNNEIKAACDVDRLTDLQSVRERFDEARWVRWNHVRAFASIPAFGLLTSALVKSGQVL